MIPKIIHYVWLGNKPKPKKIEKCIASWYKFCSDYEINEWNETNFDINCHQFVKDAYEAGNYAFASDVIRLIVLYRFGGIYVDSDVELLRPLDTLLDNKAFVGFETYEYVNSGQILGTEKNNPIINEHLGQYDTLKYNESNALSEITCPKLLTELLLSKGLKPNNREQIVSGMHIYPSDYFNPFDARTGKMKKTENSYSVHWSAHSWINMNPLASKFTRLCHRLFGNDCFNLIKRILRR